MKPEITVKYFGVGAIFLMSGLGLKTEELKKAAMALDLHATIQGFSLLATPMIVCTVAGFLETSFLAGEAASKDVLSFIMGIKVTRNVTRNTTAAITSNNQQQLQPYTTQHNENHDTTQ